MVSSMAFNRRSSACPNRRGSTRRALSPPQAFLPSFSCASGGLGRKNDHEQSCRDGSLEVEASTSLGYSYYSCVNARAVLLYYHANAEAWPSPLAH